MFSDRIMFIAYVLGGGKKGLTKNKKQTKTKNTSPMAGGKLLFSRLNELLEKACLLQD